MGVFVSLVIVPRRENVMVGVRHGPESCNVQADVFVLESIHEVRAISSPLSSVEEAVRPFLQLGWKLLVDLEGCKWWGQRCIVVGN